MVSQKEEGSLFTIAFLFFSLAWADTSAPFFGGEKTSFAITYLGATAGTVDLSIESLHAGEKKDQHIYSALARTDFVFSLFYSLKNTYTSEVEGATGIPLRFTARLDESRQSGETLQIFNEQKGKVRFKDNRQHKKKGLIQKEVVKDIPAGTYDVVSALFSLRRLPLSLGKKVQIPVFIGEELSYLGAEVVGEEKLPTKIGEIPSWILKPTLMKDGKEKEIPDSQLWIGKEGTHPILKIKAKVKIGSVIAYLRSYESGQAQ